MKNILKFLERVQENGPSSRKKDETKRVIGLGRTTRQEIVKCSRMTALTLQTWGIHQTSPTSLLGWNSMNAGQKHSKCGNISVYVAFEWLLYWYNNAAEVLFFIQIRAPQSWSNMNRRLYQNLIFKCFLYLQKLFVSIVHNNYCECLIPRKSRFHLLKSLSSKVLPLRPGVGQYKAMHAMPIARNFFLAIISTFLVHSP